MLISRIRQTDNYVPDIIRAMSGTKFPLPKDIVLGNGTWDAGIVARNTPKQPVKTIDLSPALNALTTEVGQYSEVAVRDKEGNYLAVAPVDFEIQQSDGFYQNAEVNLFLKSQSQSELSTANNQQTQGRLIAPRLVNMKLKVTDDLSDAPGFQQRTRGSAQELSQVLKNLSGLSGLIKTLQEEAEQESSDEDTTDVESTNSAQNRASKNIESFVSAEMNIGVGMVASVVMPLRFIGALREPKLQVPYVQGLFGTITIYTRVYN